MKYFLHKKVSYNFETAIEKATEQLKKNGFGIVTEMNIDKTLKEKINVDFRKYRILGACNPHFAHQALLADNQIGNLLPCNVVIQEHENGEVEVSAINPRSLFGIIEKPEFAAMAAEVGDILDKVIQDI
ncbi:MAG: DUF302 domain-containing protein [Bacteroidetes bacterium]|jgi:uncharacterized protein (DUF302 family)|nr:DUF302 domain-containing protein [Bacteroidota bacterium]MBT5528838.1 DUF302 domain-containing protein [Cytophagia bacterium]MBT3423081.1 DUF302 domain-containing protein [Bacteroidota bacterium]MBT3802850.1 DUF302 domain-containing protein [Bacteroidota bacterium]MBT3933655.1 DUF302 domain-containing protein [Bacteroidota bacterium]